MLNKLLKRCMPWMNKGRWHKLVLQGTGENYIVDKELSDQVFSNSSVEFDADNKIITIENPGAVFWENKCTIEYMDMLTGITLDIFSALNVLIVGVPINSVAIPPHTGVKLTLWMFGG